MPLVPEPGSDPSTQPLHSSPSPVPESNKPVPIDTTSTVQPVPQPHHTPVSDNSNLINISAAGCEGTATTGGCEGTATTGSCEGTATTGGCEGTAQETNSQHKTMNNSRNQNSQWEQDQRNIEQVSCRRLENRFSPGFCS